MLELLRSQTAMNEKLVFPKVRSAFGLKTAILKNTFEQKCGALLAYQNAFMRQIREKIVIFLAL